MKSLALALLLGAVSSASPTNEQTIWDETEAVYDVCGDQQTRWKNPSNSWNTYKNAYLGKTKFVDTDFDADWSMIYAKNAPPQGTRVTQYHKQIVAWKRPSEIYPGEELHLKGKLGEFSPNGIKQGGMSDCWFLAGATALSEDPTRMYQVVHKNSRQNYNPTGVFRYFFWVKNKWVAINIDDRLPARYKYSNSKDYFSTFASGRSDFGAWWMPLFEKAYSKLNGNYDRIEWGSGYESLRQLTARPVFFFQHEKIKSNENADFELFHKLSQENYPMVISCCDVPRNSKAPDGLQNAHAYTLLDVVQIPGGTKLAKIRNPWSTEGYNGEWSDNDPKWTPELLKKLGHKKANDGIFFMPFHQFLNKPYFKSTTVSVYKQFTRSKIYNIVQTTQQMAITIKIPSRQVVYFTIETQNPRFEKNCAKSGQVFVNTYVYKGTRFPGNAGLLHKLGYMGSSMYHSTAGTPDYVYNRGTYTMMVANWACKGACSPLEYSLTVYQEGSGTVNINY